MDRHTESVISEVMNDVAKILEYYENEQDMMKEEWSNFFNYELPNMVSKQQFLLKEMLKNEKN